MVIHILGWFLLLIPFLIILIIIFKLRHIEEFTIILLMIAMFLGISALVIMCIYYGIYFIRI